MPNPSDARRDGRAILSVPLNRIRPDPLQPRRLFPKESIDALAESIRLHGQLTPLLLRPGPAGGYLLIAGARRLMALKRLRRPTAEAVVLAADDCDGALLALVENLQREDLHYLDVAAACRRLLDAQPITQARLAAGLSMSPSALANRLRLLNLPEEVQRTLRRSGLSERHARALLRLPDPAAQQSYAAMAAEQGMSVSQLEARIAHQLQHDARIRPQVSRLVRDNRIVINAVLNTVRELTRIGVPVKSRVEEQADRIDVIVSIPVGKKQNEAAGS